MSKLKFRRAYLTLAAAFTMVGASAGGCGGGGDSVTAIAQVGGTSSALTSAQLLSADGTYGGGCISRSGSWSLVVKAGAVLAHPALSVVKGNDACVLTLTSLTADGDYLASPSIALSGTFQTSSSAFAKATATVSFYGNAHLSATDFLANFVVDILYSDDTNVGTAGSTNTYGVESSSASASSVPAPSYTISLTPLLIQTDASNIVQTATGTADLTDGDVTGQSYVVVASLAATPAFSDIDTAFRGGTPVVITSANPQILAAAFSLAGVSLTVAKTRYVIISNQQNGVPSYQLFILTFSSM